MADIEKDLLQIHLASETAVRQQLQEFCGSIAGHLSTMAEVIGMLLEHPDDERLQRRVREEILLANANIITNCRVIAEVGGR